MRNKMEWRQHFHGGREFLLETYADNVEDGNLVFEYNSITKHCLASCSFDVARSVAEQIKSSFEKIMSVATDDELIFHCAAIATLVSWAMSFEDLATGMHNYTTKGFLPDKPANAWESNLSTPGKQS